MLAPPSGQSWDAPRGHTLHPCRWDQTQANRHLRLHGLRKAGEAREAQSTIPEHIAPVMWLPQVLPECSRDLWLRERVGRWKEKKQKVLGKVSEPSGKGQTLDRAKHL